MHENDSSVKFLNEFSPFRKKFRTEFVDEKLMSETSFVFNTKVYLII